MRTTTLRRRLAQSPWLALILGTYLLLALGYGLVNPVFEAPDEHWHYFTAQYIADTGQLPVVAPEPDPWLEQEAAQPPLYYIVAGLLIRPLDTDGAREMVFPNPFVQLGDASSPANLNAFVHGPWEQWPWQNYALATHLLRVLSVFIGLGTLVAIYGSSRLLWPESQRRSLLATALVAFLPQFLFLHSAVSNDPLVILLATAALWQLLVIWLGNVSSTRLILLGVTIGLAILTKTAGLLLLVYATGVLLLWSWRRQHSLWTAGKSLVLLLGPVLLLSGWLLLRNWTLYGDITAANQFVRIAGGDRQYTFLDVLAESGSLWTSLFAIFGWFNVRAPAWVYWIWYGLILLAASGWFISWLPVPSLRRVPGRRRVLRSLRSPARKLAPLILAGWPLLVYAGLVSFMLRTPAAQGRLLFPALLPLGLAVAYGLERFPWRPLPLLSALLALLTAFYSLASVIPAVYAPPALVSEAAIPEQATAYQAQLDQGLELLGATVENPEVQPGDVVWLNLYWQGGAEVAAAPEIVVELFGYEQSLVGKLQSYHGGGLYPPQLWPEQGIIADRVGIRLSPKVATPTEVTIYVGVAGEVERSVVGAVKVVPETWPPARDRALAELDGQIRLVEAAVTHSEAKAGEHLTVDVMWEVIAPPRRSLTTFVHLGSPTEPPLATGDSVPREGYYPTTWWEAGEVIEDSYTVRLPSSLAPGRYPVLLGMYDPESGERLSLTVAGERQVADAYPVSWVTVR